MRIKLLVTGGLGFIGSAFVRLVIRERPNMEVAVFDALTYAANPHNVAEIADSSRYRFIAGNITDKHAVQAALSSGFDAIVNFAAETHVDRSIIDPESFIRTNVLGTHVLLEAMRLRKIERFVQVSTDEVYGDVTHGSSRESDAICPRSPYAASKAGADLQVLSYYETYGSSILITRGSNTYGPCQYPEKLIPLFITNLLHGQTVPVYGDGRQMRDWLHVDDHARGILHVLERGITGEVYNLGGGNERENIEIARRLIASTGRNFNESIRYVADRLGHDRRYALNCEKAHALGWQPTVPFEDGLRETVEWYRTQQDWWKTYHASEVTRHA